MARRKVFGRFSFPAPGLFQSWSCLRFCVYVRRSAPWPLRGLRPRSGKKFLFFYLLSFLFSLFIVFEPSLFKIQVIVFEPSLFKKCWKFLSCCRSRSNLPFKSAWTQLRSTFEFGPFRGPFEFFHWAAFGGLFPRPSCCSSGYLLRKRLFAFSKKGIIPSWNIVLLLQK